MRLMRVHVIFLAVASLFSLGACTTLEYTLAPDEKRASVRTLGSIRLTLCKDGEIYRLPVVAQNSESLIYHIPVDQKVGLIGDKFYSYSGSTSLSCTPAVAFTPVAGQRYIFDAQLLDNGCVADVVREDGREFVGIAPEPSIVSAKGVCIGGAR